MSKVRRAFAAADHHLGNEVLIQLTITQAAALWHVSTAYVHHALRRTGQRVLIEDGVLPLVPPITRLAMSAPVQDTDLVVLASHVGADRWLAAAQAGLWGPPKSGGARPGPNPGRGLLEAPAMHQPLLEYLAFHRDEAVVFAYCGRRCQGAGRRQRFCSKKCRQNAAYENNGHTAIIPAKRSGSTGISTIPIKTEQEQ
jgi:hypothetical protein